MHPGDLTQGCSDLEMTWLLCCAGAATGDTVEYRVPCRKRLVYDSNVTAHTTRRVSQRVTAAVGSFEFWLLRQTQSYAYRRGRYMKGTGTSNEARQIPLGKAKFYPSLPFLSLPFSCPIPLPLPPLPSPFLPLPSLPFRSGPLNPTRGCGGAL